LKLGDNERASFNAANIGSFVHAILENFFRSMRENNLDVKSLSDATKKEMTSSAARKYLGELFPGGDFGSARMRVMLSRLERASEPVIDSLCREFADCKFLPTFFELKIARNVKDSPAPVTFTREDGGRVYVYGTIDRVDTYTSGADTYVRVIDYKTGTKQFSPKDLEAGRNLQMFLYLKSVIDTDSADFKRVLGADENGRVLPAGVIYVHTSISDTTVKREDAAIEREEIAKTQKRAGMLLDDEVSLSAMNKEFLPVSLDKNGMIKQTDRLYTEDGWETLSKTIERAVLQVADGIRSGCAHAPKKQGTDKKICGYCEYKAICRNASL
jgi:ATP-dependent helicase/nuclease subunit B